MRATVVAVAAEGARSRRYVLRAIDSAHLPGFAAGAHIALNFQHPELGSQSRRYSLINPPNGGGAADSYEIVVQREEHGTGGSAWLTDQLQPGSIIDVVGPYQHFPLADDAVQPVLLAAGIGITPLLAMARTLDRQARPYQLHYFARSPADAPLARQVRDLHVGTTAVHCGVGVADVAVRVREALGTGPGARHVYACGPSGFIGTALDQARNLGWPESHLHSELFAIRPTAGDRPFRVRLTGSGRTIDVPADQSMLQALAGHGVPLATACGAGLCGSCLVTVLEGVVDHRDSFMSDGEKAANDMMCPCVSRAFTDEITIDL